MDVVQVQHVAQIKHISIVPSEKLQKKKKSP